MFRSKLAILFALTLTLALAPTTSAASASFTGEILVGLPTGFFVGFGENVAPCDPDSEFNNIDGFWADLTGLAFEPTDYGVQPGPATNVAIWFYTDGCDYIDGDTWLLNPLFPENYLDPPVIEGDVPPNTGFVYVGGWTGGPGEITLTVSD